MGLANLLYRCPRCGTEPVEGEKDQVRCTGCGRSFVRGRGHLEILETEPGAPGGPTRAVPAWVLTEAIRAMGGPLTRAMGPDGSISDAARVLFRRSLSEEPVYFRGRLLGFCEMRSEEAEGELRIRDRTVSLVRGDGTESWDLLDLLALQTSSSSVQISTRDGGVIQFKFVSDSSRRWEDLLRLLVARAWREAGRGEILEFQPRIITGPGGSA
jgi:DNA-directed RNA polymerase subunit RPC12/RpoP